MTYEKRSNLRQKIKGNEMHQNQKIYFKEFFK